MRGLVSSQPWKAARQSPNKKACKGQARSLTSKHLVPDSVALHTLHNGKLHTLALGSTTESEKVLLETIIAFLSEPQKDSQTVLSFSVIEKKNIKKNFLIDLHIIFQANFLLECTQNFFKSEIFRERR